MVGVRIKGREWFENHVENLIRAWLLCGCEAEDRTEVQNDFRVPGFGGRWGVVSLFAESEKTG